MKRQLITYSLVGALAVSLMGCTANVSGEIQPENAEANDSQPVALPEGLKGYVLGEKVTDIHGTYTRIKLADDNKLNILDQSLLEDSALATGYSLDDILEAQKFVSNFLIEEGLDSITLDVDRWDEWKSSVSGLYIRPGDEEAMLGATTDGDPSRFIARHNNDYPLVYMRDGGPRFESVDLEVSAVEGGDEPGHGRYLNFFFAGFTDYKVTDENAVTRIKEQFKMPEEEFNRRINPDLLDGEGFNIWPVRQWIRYSVTWYPELGWRINGYNTEPGTHPDGWVSE